MDDDLYESACRHAEECNDELGITDIPIDLGLICKKLKIELKPLPGNSGPSSMLIRNGDDFVIAYSTHTGSEGFERFSIAHELGHYRLPGHPATCSIHQSETGFMSDSTHEREADFFAAALLMPKKIFGAAISDSGEGIEAIKKLAHKFGTSLEATAIRYTNLTEDPVAIVVSTKEKIDYCFMSPSFKEIKGLTWIRKNEPLPKASSTFKFNQDANNVSTAQYIEECSDLSEWFGCNNEIEVCEAVLGLGKFGRTLTLLYSVELPNEDEIDEDELQDSWTPKFRR